MHLLGRNPGTWDWLDRISVDGGIRYNSENKQFTTVATNRPEQGGGSPALIGGESEDTFRGLSGEVSIAYELSPGASVYTKYSRGWKPGHFNGAVTDVEQIVEPVDPEIVNAIELGFRSFWLDGRLTANVTGFFYDYDSLQVFLLEQNTRGFAVPQLINANEATVKGFELDLMAQPLEQLEVRYSLAFLESAYNDFSNTFTESVLIPGQGVEIRTREIDYSGNRLIASPRWSMTGGASYTQPLAGERFGSLRPRFSFSWKDDVFYDPNEGAGQKDNLPHGEIGQEAYWILNAGLDWISPEKRWELSFWVRNFLDEAYVVQAFDLSDQQRLTLHAYGDPRTFGGTVTFRWIGY
jgi:iron complex outermembrane receptor protein